MARNILASLLVNPGDVIMMTSALELMRRKLPRDTRLGALLRPGTAEILEGSAVVDEVIIYPYRSGSLFYGLGDLRKKIKRGNYNFFLSLDRRPRGALAAFITGIKKRVGPNVLYEGSREELWTRLLFTETIELSREECSGSQVEMFQLIARRAFDIQGQGRISLPSPSPARLQKVGTLLAFSQTSGPLIGLCVKTNDPSKTWPAEGFSILIEKLHRELHASIYITGSKDDADYVAGVLQMTPSTPALNLAGKTELMDLQALALKSDLFIGPDNATTHLIANSGLKKMICLLLGTSKGKIFDSMPEAVFIRLSGSRVEGTGDGKEQTAGEAELVFKAAKDILAQ